MINIDVINRHEANEYKVVDDKYEYSRILLENHQSKYIYVPLSVITDTELDIRRIGILSYLKVHCGLNDIVGFTIPDIVEWCGGKPDRRTNGSNDKALLTIDALNDRGYLTYLTDRSKSSYMKCKIDAAFYYNDCSNGYAILYLDEIEKIMSYKRDNSKDSTLNNFAILLTFAYLRNKIWRRGNVLKPEERSSEGIKKRRERIPEAYDCNIMDIASDIGISPKTLSKIVDILECDLKLIVTDRAYRIKTKDNEYRTLPTIFANAYKRDDKYLLNTGDDYSRTEIALKANNIQNYKIDKSKRR